MKALPIDIDWHSGLSIYASEQFLKTAGAEYGWLGGMDHLGRRRCILPYTVVKRATVRMVRFRVQTISLDEMLGLQEEKVFLNSAVEYFRSIGADLIIPATTNAIFRTYPDNAMAAPYGTYVIDLRQSEEVLWKNVHSKHRNVIRNAHKKGVRILSGMEFAKTVYRLIQETFKRSSLPFMSYNTFERMVLGLGENVKLFVADWKGFVQGCAVIPFSQQGAYYSYGGTVSEPLSGATNLLQWEAIRYFRSLGVKCYDFCGVRINPKKGSKAAGLMMYKQRFGPQLLQGYMWKYHLNPLKSAIYSLGIRMLRGGDIVDRERHKLTTSLVVNSASQLRQKQAFP
jgi:peptidoglycan biosynthesis/recognition FemAB-like protein